MLGIILNRTLLFLALFIAGTILQGCGSKTTNRAAGPSPELPSFQTSPKPTPATIFEKDLAYLRKGQYSYVWVFSRKDRKPLDKDDAAFLRSNAPQVVDWVTTDEGKRVIAGTNFDLEQGNLKLLKKRFVIEDYSGR
jgi:hypothetical protein